MQKQPHQGLLCVQKTSSSGISSSLAGSGFWVAGNWIQLISAPAGEAGEQLSRVKQSYQEEGGPNSPYSIVWRASPPLLVIWDGDSEGLERRAVPSQVSTVSEDPDSPLPTSHYPLINTDHNKQTCPRSPKQGAHNYLKI